ncbi:MAG: glycosyltransferase family 2 protein [Lachnospiraceae bacterium]|nr:glycosyltransferase family 2 protein [Lachnospiraceae bacterium]
MSLKAKLKQRMKECLIHKCDREYDRTYRYAQNRFSYGGLISLLESTFYLEEEESFKEFPVYIYSFKEEIDMADLEKAAKKGEYLIFCESEVYLHVHAQAWIKEWVNTHPETLILYGDEDVIGADGQRSNPWLKPMWSPTLFLQAHYLGGLTVAKSDLVLQVIREGGQSQWKLGARKLFYMLCKAAGGYGLRKNTIWHMDKILCHQPDSCSYDKFFQCEELTYDSLELKKARKPMVSVIIPSKNQVEILRQNLQSLEKTANKANIEVIVVDNGSALENKERIEKLIQELTFDSKYIYNPMEFNFSAMCNMGAKESRGEYLLFLNDDIEAVSLGWLDEMAHMASREYVGCVGAKLLYPQTGKIQHAGVVSLPIGPVHKLQFQEDDEKQYFHRNKLNQETLAVTGACLMVRRQLFEEVEGFDENLAVTFNDIDLCYKLYAKGYYNVCLNRFYLYHHESLSRGEDVSLEKKKRLVKERENLWNRHKELTKKDPYYHKWLNRKTSDMSVRPALEEFLDAQEEQASVKPWSKSSWKDVRPFEGVVCTVEQNAGTKLSGYLFIMGDDNACYERRIIFRNITTDHAFWCRLNQTLREDLRTNMPDQKNVALSGFEVKLLDLPTGEYEITAVAHNKISGVSYCKETGTIVGITEE